MLPARLSFFQPERSIRSLVGVAATVIQEGHTALSPSAPSRAFVCHASTRPLTLYAGCSCCPPVTPIPSTPTRSGPLSSSAISCVALPSPFRINLGANRACACDLAYRATPTTPSVMPALLLRRDDGDTSQPGSIVGIWPAIIAIVALFMLGGMLFKWVLVRRARQSAFFSSSHADEVADFLFDRLPAFRRSTWPSIHSATSTAFVSSSLRSRLRCDTRGLAVPRTSSPFSRPTSRTSLSKLHSIPPRRPFDAEIRRDGSGTSRRKSETSAGGVDARAGVAVRWRSATRSRSGTGTSALLAERARHR